MAKRLKAIVLNTHKRDLLMSRMTTEREDFQHLLTRLAAILTEDQVSALILVHVDGFTQHMAAQELGLSQSGVCKLISEAHKKCELEKIILTSE